MGKTINKLEAGPNPYEGLSREELLQEMNRINSEFSCWEDGDEPDSLYENLWLIMIVLDKKNEE